MTEQETAQRLKTGDVWLQTTPGHWMSKLIATFTRHRGEDRTRATHQGIVWVHEGTCTLIEAQMGGVKTVQIETKLLEMHGTGAVWWVVRPPMDSEDLAIVDDACEKLATGGIKYGFSEILLQGVDGLLGFIAGRDVIWARKLGKLNKKRAICSKVGNLPLVQAELMPPDAVYWSPDGTDDYCADEGWEVVAESGITATQSP